MNRDSASKNVPWQLVPLDLCGDLYCGQSPSVAEVNADGRGEPYFTGPEQWDGTRLHVDKWTEFPKRPVPDGCIFITVKGAGVGKLFPGMAGAIGRDIYAFRVHPELEFKYIYYALRHTIDSIVLQAKGDIPGLSKAHILDHQILIPGLAQQRRIVAKVEELLSELDNGVEALTTARKQLAVYRQSVLQYAFDGKFTTGQRGNQSEGWTDVALDTIGDIQTGNTPPTKQKAFFGGDVPFFKPTDLEAGYRLTESRDHLSQAGLEVSRSFPANSVLVTCIGATIGKTGLARVGGSCNQQINFVIPAKGMSPAFIYFQVISPSFQEQIKRNASSTTLPILNKGKFSQLRFRLCSFKEQEHLASFVEHRLAIADGMEQDIDDGLTRCEAMRQSILKQAFSGQLVAQDSSDEPASALLERIRAKREREAGPQKGRIAGNGKNGKWKAA